MPQKPDNYPGSQEQYDAYYKWWVESRGGKVGGTMGYEDQPGYEDNPVGVTGPMPHPSTYPAGQAGLNFRRAQEQQQALLQQQLEYMQWQMQLQKESIATYQRIMEKYDLTPAEKDEMKNKIRRSYRGMLETMRKSDIVQGAASRRQIAQSAEARGIQRSGAPLDATQNMMGQLAQRRGALKAGEGDYVQKGFEGYEDRYKANLRQQAGAQAQIVGMGGKADFRGAAQSAQALTSGYMDEMKWYQDNAQQEMLRREAEKAGKFGWGDLWNMAGKVGGAIVGGFMGGPVGAAGGSQVFNWGAGSGSGLGNTVANDDYWGQSDPFNNWGQR